MSILDDVADHYQDIHDCGHECTPVTTTKIRERRPSPDLLIIERTTTTACESCGVTLRRRQSSCWLSVDVDRCEGTDQLELGTVEP